MQLSGHASQAAVYGTTIAFVVAAGMLVTARLATRLYIVRQPGLDDAFVCVGFVFALVMSIAICKQASFGMGLHMDELPKAWLAPCFAWYWAFMWTYYGTLCFTKLSILLQYLRIFPHPWFRKTCFVLIGVVAVWGVWAVLSAIFMCHPVNSFWDVHVFAWDQPNCLPRAAIWYLNGAINVVTDCAIVALPLPVVNSLEMPRKQRYIVMAVFGVGYLTCLVSILRLVYIYPVSTSPDTTWSTPLSAIWSAVEANIGIMCCCTPTLKGCVKKYFPKLMGSIRSQRLLDSEDSAGLGNLTGANNEIKVVIEAPAKAVFPYRASLQKWLQPSILEKSALESFATSCTRTSNSHEGLAELLPARCVSPPSYPTTIEVHTSVDQTTEVVTKR